MSDYIVKPSTVSGSIIAPPSKSHTLRAILFASMANGTSKIHRYLKSPDTVAMVEACQKLGAEIQVSDTTIEIMGVSGKPRIPDDVINAGNSGQVLRFVAAMAALTDGYSIFTGDHSVRFNRPIQPLMDGLTSLGAECISTKGDGHAPMVIKGPIAPGVATLDGRDSQPVSALLMASAFVLGKTEIKVTNPGEKPWVALTLAWLDKLGIKYSNHNFESYSVEGRGCIDAFEYTVPGDFSSIAYPMAAAILTKSSLSINNIDINDAQGDKKIIDVLASMGANIQVHEDVMTISPSEALSGCDIDVNEMIDALPILAVIACFAKGTTTLSNAAIARKKESDRLSAITSELKVMGAAIIENEDSLTISGMPLQGANMRSHKDHRIAMSLIVAGLAAQSDSIICDVQCISKSYPGFYDDMRSIGVALEVAS